MENWTRAPQIDYGVPGGVSVTEKGFIETARQHQDAGFIATGTKQLAKPIFPPFPFGEHASSRFEALDSFMTAEVLGGVDFNELKAIGYESQVLTSPSAIDPLMGDRVHADSNGNVVFGDDRYLMHYKGDKRLKIFDLGSFVMQVSHSVCRTRKGVAWFDKQEAHQREAPVYIVEGEFMHTSEVSNNRISTVTNSGVVGLWDVENGTDLWQLKCPQGNYTGWSRVYEWDPNILLWNNSYEMRTLDTRVSPAKKSGHLVFQYEDRQFEIKAVSQPNNNTVFALTSFQLLQIRNSLPQVALSFEHHASRQDYSLTLAHTSVMNGSKHIVTSTSQIMPQTCCWVFGSTESGLPCSLSDPYFMDAWPTIIPQSHTLASDELGLKLYSVGAHGGLYMQNWRAVDRDVALDEVIDVPVPDPDLQIHPVIVQDFDISGNFNPVGVYNFREYYKFAFSDPQLPEKLPQTKSSEFKALGFESKASFEQYLKEMWVKPLELKGGDIETRRKWMQMVVKDMEAATSEFGTPVPEMCNIAELNKEVQDILDEWDITEDPQSQFTQSQFTQSQLSQSQLSQSQSQVIHPQLSQPVLGPKKKKRRKGKKK